MLLFIAKNNLKKRKDDVIVLFCLIALATLLLYVSVSVLTGTGKVLDTAFETAHTADFLFLSNLKKEEEIEKIFLKQEEVKEYETSDCIYAQDAQYRKDQTREKKDFSFWVNTIEEERNISKLTGINKEEMSYDSVIISYYLMISEKYEVGDSFFLTLGGQEYEFKVAGYSEDPLTTTPLTVALYNVYITEAYMEDILAENPLLKDSMGHQYRIRLQDGESSNDFEENVMTILIKEIPELASSINVGVNWEVMKAGVSVMSNISMAIIFTFSILLIAISLIIVRFSIRNFMELNLKNIGILQASGYTVSQLQLVSVVEMGCIALCGIVVGIISGILGGYVIGNVQGMLLGIAWNQGTNVGTALMIAGISFVTMTGGAALTSVAYRRMSVLDALRGGIYTHNFKKNYFSFERSCLPRSIVLAGKNIMGEKRKNLSIFCIIVLLTFATGVGVTLYRNFAMDTNYLEKLVGLEAGDISLTGENLEQIGEEIENWEEIEQVLYGDTCSIQMSKGANEKTINCDIWENPALIRNEMLVRGRLPKYENEIVLTVRSAAEMNADIGDVIYVQTRGKKKDYIVTGIDQKINQMGLNSLMTMEGAKRLNGVSQIRSIYLYKKPGVTYEDIQSKLEKEYPRIEVQNTEKMGEELLSVVVAGIVAICVVFIVVTIFVVAMVEVLLVRSKIIKERKNYGINKALGYTTGQLIEEAMMMNMPVITLGAVIGAGLSVFLINPMMILCLSSFGIEKCDMTIAPIWLVFVVIGIVLVAVGISFLSALGIRKIEPVKMLEE